MSTNQDQSIEWEDLPPKDLFSQRGRGKLQLFIEELKKNPGKWAVYSRDTTHAANVTRFKEYGAEAACRLQADRLYTIYARWPES